MIDNFWKEKQTSKQLIERFHVPWYIWVVVTMKSNGILREESWGNSEICALLLEKVRLS